MDLVADSQGRAEYCTRFHAAIELIGRRWNGLIVRALLGGPLRFAELGSRIPRITDAMLSQRLKELEGAAIATREVSGGRPVEVRYSLTKVGYELGPVMDAVGAWSEHWELESPAGLADQVGGQGQEPAKRTQPRRKLGG